MYAVDTKMIHFCGVKMFCTFHFFTYADNSEENVSLIMTTGFQSGFPFPIGTTVVMFEATDIYGNSAYCNFTVTVEGNTYSAR